MEAPDVLDEPRADANMDIVSTPLPLWRSGPGPSSPTSSTSSSSPSYPLDDAVASRAWCGMLRLQAVARHLYQLTPSSLPPQPPPCRRQSDFSIARILSPAGPGQQQAEEPGPGPGPCSEAEGHFDWLHCTRYRPPKLPRSRRRDGPAQRRLGRNPRIPFSSQQVSVLEGRFRRSHYLSSADVAELSSQLELSEIRVKIWFQNRRARERRDGETRATGENLVISQTLSSGTSGVGPSQLPRSSLSAFTAPSTARKHSISPGFNSHKTEAHRAE